MKQGFRFTCRTHVAARLIAGLSFAGSSLLTGCADSALTDENAASEPGALRILLTTALNGPR